MSAPWCLTCRDNQRWWSSSWRKLTTCLGANGVLTQIPETEGFKFEREALVWRALHLYRNGGAGFSDYLIGEIGRHAGCRDNVTFDRSLKSAAGFTGLT